MRSHVGFLMPHSKVKIKCVAVVAVIALLAVVSTNSPVSAFNKDGGKCLKAGAKTRSSPSITLICTKVGKTLKWKKLTSSTSKCGSSAPGAFTHAPFNAADVAIITNGEETNDARFNHVTAPRADIKAAYEYGKMCSSCFDDNGNPTAQHEEREIPKVNLAVKAGDLLGYTTGTPSAHDRDFAIQISEKTVRPFSVLAEPHKTTLLNLLGPKSATPSGPPTPGYACTGYGARD
jgi:hypothetical protein